MNYGTLKNLQQTEEKMKENNKEVYFSDTLPEDVGPVIICGDIFDKENVLLEIELLVWTTNDIGKVGYLQISNTLGVLIPVGLSCDSIEEIYSRIFEKVTKRHKTRKERHKEYRLRTYAGDCLHHVLEKLLEKSSTLGHPVYAEFNGIFILASPEDSIISLRCQFEQKYDALQEIRSSKKSSKKKEQICKNKRRRKEEEFQEILDMISGEELKIKEGLEEEFEGCILRNGDPYGSAIIRYAEILARTMQVKLREGKDFNESIKDLQFKCDVEGITGSMHVFAMNFLCQFWIHGEKLKQWRIQEMNNM